VIARAAAVLGVFMVGVIGVLAAVTRDPWPSNDGLTVAVLAVLIAVGLVIVRQQQRNAVGWLFVATGLIALVDTLCREYLVLDYRQHGGSLAFGRVAVEVRGGMALTAFLVAFPAILLFPEGKVPSVRWRRALWAYVVGATVFSVAQFAGEATVHVGAHPAISIRGAVPNWDPGWFADHLWVLSPLFLAFWLASVGYQVRCWRRAKGERRAQLKWVMSGAAICVVSSVGIVLTGDDNSLWARPVADVALVGVAALPIAIGVGILRYRLYEIDRLISRTISYTVVTGLLVGLFLGVVLLATRVLPFSSPVAVAASTLAAAACFNPLRRRVQRVVDRRFNRARYDAGATVAAFSARLRDAMDLDAQRALLSTTVHRVVEPAHTAIWIRSDER